MRSWLVSRPPWRLNSAYSTRKRSPALCARLRALYTPFDSSMIASMTGFARCERAGTFGTLVCEIRSVNHRFLDASLRLPESCRALEPDLRQLLARDLRRGRVDCTVMQRSPEAATAGLEIDTAALERLLARVRQLCDAVPGQAQVN